MIRLVCALKCEAMPVIHYYRMAPLDDTTLFRSYLAKDGHISLTITGTGKVPAAMATIYNAITLPADGQGAWINFGIAGHASYPVGTAVLVNKVIDASNNSVWYPQILFNSRVTQSMLMTHDQPSLTYNDDSLHDMEASGFYQAACHFTTAELAHVFKVVSDNYHQPATNISAALASRLITDNIQALDNTITALFDLTSQTNQPTTPPYLDEILARWHFTQSQRFRLKHLLRRWQVLLPDQPVPNNPHQFRTARELLVHMHKILDNAPIHLG